MRNFTTPNNIGLKQGLQQSSMYYRVYLRVIHIRILVIGRPVIAHSAFIYKELMTSRVNIDNSFFTLLFISGRFLSMQEIIFLKINHPNVTFFHVTLHVTLPSKRSFGILWEQSYLTLLWANLEVSIFYKFDFNSFIFRWKNYTVPVSAIMQ